MANTKSAKKNIRKTERRRAVNRSRRGAMRTEIKKLRGLIEAKDAEGATTQMAKTLPLIDRSAGKGTMHRNTAARTKSRLTRAVRGLSAS